MNVKYDKQTAVGYATNYNKLKCLEAISSVPGVDLTRGVCSSLSLHLFIPSPFQFLFLPFISLIYTLAQYGNGIIQLFTGSKYFWREEGECLHNVRSKNRKRTERSEKKGPMCLALWKGHEEAAKILARKGADCTEEEKARLGKKYTNFQQIQKREQAARQGQKKAKRKKQRARGKWENWQCQGGGRGKG